NLRDDVGERYDISNMQTEKRDELLSDLFAWFESTGALLPSEPNPDYDPEKKPANQNRKRGQKAAK
ncbi:MAG: hypothetical protein KDA66_04605, partial [Planctomycetaceae bacterium]|nr:hypothetical protein [Planctomycetaceae bacterium]